MNFLASLMSSVLGAIMVALTLPMINAYGAAVMYLLFAVLIWISYGYVVDPTNGFADNDIVIAGYTTSSNLVTR